MFAGRFKDQEHLLRVVGLFLAALVVFFILRALLVPEGFGVYGHFRAGALDDNRAGPVAFAGGEACAACHDEVVQLRGRGKHAKVNCEACHGAQSRHAQADDPSAHKPERPGPSLCPVCHTVNLAKPASFPQVVPREHADGTSCLECHAAHDPTGEAAAAAAPSASAAAPAPEAKP